MTYRHAGDQPVYAPNTKGGPEAGGVEHGADLGWDVEAGELARYAYRKHAEDDDFVQPRTLYNEVMGDAERQKLVDGHRGPRGHAGGERADDPARDRLLGQRRRRPRRARGGRARRRATATAPAASNGASAEASELLAARANRA